MIRVLVVDDHPAVRAGLLAVLRCEPGLTPVGAASSTEKALQEAQRTACTVALVDLHLGDENGLALCRELKRLAQAPRVLIYSSFVTTRLVVPASLAGADGLLDKGAPTSRLFDVIRGVSRGKATLPKAAPALMAATAARLDPDDLPILGMAMEGTPLADIADALRISQREVDGRIGVMLQRLSAGSTGPGSTGPLPVRSDRARRLHPPADR